MTQEIKPAYVTFEQAKWLKEKGFKGRSRYYGGSGELVEVPNIIENDYRHTNNEMQRFRWEAPEQHQVVEWLRVNHGIWVSVNIAMDDKWYFELYNLKDKRNAEIIIEGENVTDFHNSTKEAYSAAFDYILNNNLI
jgi:hypothetical protein